MLLRTGSRVGEYGELASSKAWCTLRQDARGRRPPGRRITHQKHQHCSAATWHIHQPIARFRFRFLRIIGWYSVVQDVVRRIMGAVENRDNGGWGACGQRVAHSYLCLPQMKSMEDTVRAAEGKLLAAEEVQRAQKAEINTLRCEHQTSASFPPIPSRGRTQLRANPRPRWSLAAEDVYITQ